MPNVTDVHVDMALTNFSIGYAQGEYVAEKLAPRFAVKHKSDEYFLIDEKREALRRQITAKAPGAPAQTADWDLSTSNYNCTAHAQTGSITQEERANVDAALQELERDKVDFLTEIILVDKEMDLASALATGITATASPTVKWDLSTSDPIADVKAGRIIIVNAIQKRPNTLMLPFEVFEEVCDHPNIIERVKAGGTMNNAAVVNEQALAQVFKVDQVIVASAYKNTAAKGATPSTSNIWGDTVYLCFVDPQSGLKKLSMAKTFGWMLKGVNGRRVRTWTDDVGEADKFEVSDYYDQKVTVAGAGYKLTSTLT